MTHPEKTCATCGAKLSPGPGEGLCLKCLGNLGFFSEASPAEPGSLMRLGDFVLLEEIGRGGMGVVYRARQTSLNRIVALKVVLHGPFSSPAFVRRFHQEAEAVAALRHPNIVAIHEIGQDAGNHFIALEYVEGRSLAELTRDGPVPAQRAAAYLKTVAEAVEHAHQRGVLHRDLTPSNILLDEKDRPRVTDFGLAKLANAAADLTLTGQVLGSPSFMSPEQARGKLGDATPCSDVYSLGAILYVLLTGRPPFQAESLTAVLAQVQDVEPVPPQRLNPDTPPDLQTICLKCLQKEPLGRYATAQELADDLGRFLGGEPIQARPVPAWERLALWSRRRPLLAAMIAAFLLTVVLGLSGILWQWRNAEFERGVAETETRQTRLNLYAADIAVASQAVKDGDFGLARRTLDGLRPKGHETDLRGFEWRYLWKLCCGDQLAILGAHAGTVTGAAFSPRGDLLATCGMDCAVQIWDVPRRRLLTHFGAVSNQPWSVAFTPDGKELMTANRANIEFRDTSAWRVQSSIPGRLAVLSKRGPFLATSDSYQFFWEECGPVKLWNWQTGQLLRTFDRPGRGLALSPDDRLLAVAGTNSNILLWDTATGGLLHDWAFSNQVWSLDFSPDGKSLLVTGWSHDFWIWPLTTDAPPTRVSGHPRHVWSASYSPDGRMIASTGSDQSVRLWDAATLQPQAVLHGHTSEVWCSAFSADGRFLATGGKDGNVMLWRAAPPPSPAMIPHDSDFRPIFSPDGKWIATVDPGAGQWRLWNTADSSLVDKSPVGGKMILGFSVDSEQVATFDDNAMALDYWAPGTGTLVKQIPLSGGPASPWPCAYAGMAPGRDFFFAITPAGVIHVWDLRDGHLVRALNGPAPPIRNAVLAPGGRQIAVCVEVEHVAHLFDCATGADHPLAGHRDFVSGLSFSPDGSLIATGSMDGSLRLWHTADGTPAGVLPGHMQETTDVAFSPDGRTLASLGRTESLKLWHVATLRELVSTELPTAGAYLAFSPDGNELAVVTAKNELQWLAAATNDAFISENANGF